MPFYMKPAPSNGCPFHGKARRDRDPYKMGVQAAQQGRSIFANPYVGQDAERWRKGYRAALQERER